MDEGPEGSGLQPVRDAFEGYGRKDPMFAALSKGGREDGRWEPEEFFARGRSEIREVVEYVSGLGLDVGRQRALDFGCAIGRLTQALADHFESVVGVDIAESMLAGARAHNRHGERVRYIRNDSPRLPFAADDSFDFVYSNKVLQHIPPAYQATYVAEFVRVLRPGGVAVFQTRNGRLVKPGTLRAWLYTLNRRHLRRTLQKLKRQPSYEMHYIARSWLEEVVQGAGGRVVDVVDVSRGRGKSLRYCIEKGSPGRF